MKRVAKDLAQLGALFKYMTSTITKWPVQISIMEGYSERTDAQNRLQHKHYAEIAKFMFDDEKSVKCMCKYDYGLPILARRETEPHWARYLAWLENLPREAQLDFMLEMTVTSEFTKKEAAEYTDTIMRVFGQQGCILTDPSTMIPDYYQEVENELKSKGVI